MRRITIALCLVTAAACSSSSSAPSGSSGSSGGSSGSSGSAGSSGSSSGSSGSSGSAGSSGSSGNPAKATCASYAFCTSMSVALYKGQTLPAPNGGTIADGMYRLAYTLESQGTGVTKDDAPGYGYLFAGGQYLGVGFGESTVGTFAISGTTLTLTPTAACDSATGKTQDGTPPAPRTRTFGIDPSGAIVFTSSSGKSAEVLIKVDSLCKGVDAAPDTPGDSFTCHVQNCGCAESSRGPADATVCKFVSGG